MTVAVDAVVYYRVSNPTICISNVENFRYRSSSSDEVDSDSSSSSSSNVDTGTESQQHFTRKHRTNVDIKTHTLKHEHHVLHGHQSPQTL